MGPGTTPATSTATTTDTGTASSGRQRQGRAATGNSDVRAMPPADRHTQIFAAFLGLPKGGSFVLVDDPKPLHYQFEAEHAGEFTWDYLETGPEVCRVRIGRA